MQTLLQKHVTVYAIQVQLELNLMVKMHQAVHVNAEVLHTMILLTDQALKGHNDFEFMLLEKGYLICLDNLFSYSVY